MHKLVHIFIAKTYGSHSIKAIILYLISDFNTQNVENSCLSYKKSIIYSCVCPAN